MRHFLCRKYALNLYRKEIKKITTNIKGQNATGARSEKTFLGK